MNSLYFTEFPVLRTQRFILREISKEDSHSIYKIRSDENVALYLDRLLAKDINDANDFINKILEGYKNKNALYWIIEYNNKFTGSICLWRIDEKEETAELGFELLPPFQGKGIIQEVLPEVINFGFNKLELKTIEAEVDKNNIKSISLLEKFGFIKIKEEDKTFIYTLKYKIATLPY